MPIRACCKWLNYIGQGSSRRSFGCRYAGSVTRQGEHCGQTPQVSEDLIDSGNEVRSQSEKAMAADRDTAGDSRDSQTGRDVKTSGAGSLLPYVLTTLSESYYGTVGTSDYRKVTGGLRSLFSPGLLIRC